MIVEPTPTTPRSPWRRALRLVGLVVPVALLGLVVGVGVLGPKADSPAARIAPPTEPVASPRAVPASGAPGASPGASPVDTAAPFPAGFAGLVAETPSEVRADRAGGGDRTTLLVAGLLDVAPGPGCDDLPGGPLGPWCARSGTIYDAETPAADAGEGAAFRPHLHLIVPVGVGLPESVAGASQAGGAPARVLVIGRFATVGCAGRCDDGFVVERVAWADGVRVGLAPLLDERLADGGKRANPFTLALADGETPLLAVLVWPDAVRDLDPAAGRLALAAPASEPVWYVRALEPASGTGVERRVRWRLLDEQHLGVIAAGHPSGEGATGDAGAGPGGDASPAPSSAPSMPATPDGAG